MNLREKIKKSKILLILFSVLFGLLIVFVIYFLLPENEIPLVREIPPQPLPGVIPPPPLPEGEFAAAITEITTFNDLINKLNIEFVFQEREDRQVRSPQEFFGLRQGNELDFAIFSAYVLKYLELGEAAVMRYKYLNVQNEQRIGTAVIFRGIDLPPKYIIFEPNNIRAVAYGWSFEELFRMEEQRIGTRITGYEIFLLWPLPTVEQLWPAEWRQR
jgi:hypothetical protein